MCSWLCYNFATGKFLDSETLSQISMVYGRNFCEKRQIWVSEPNFWEVMGDTRPWLTAHWKGWVDFLRNKIFRNLRYYGSWVIALNYTVQVFSQGVDLFALKFHLNRVVPINHSWHQKTRHTALPNGEDRILPHYLILTQYPSVIDRRTYG